MNNRFTPALNYHVEVNYTKRILQSALYTEMVSVIRVVSESLHIFLVGTQLSAICNIRMPYKYTSASPLHGQLGVDMAPSTFNFQHLHTDIQQ